MPSHFETYAASLARQRRTPLIGVYGRELQKQVMRTELGFNPKTGRLYDVCVVGEPALQR